MGCRKRQYTAYRRLLCLRESMLGVSMNNFIRAFVSASVCTGITCFIYAEHAWLREPCATAKAGTLPILGIHRGECRTLSAEGRIKRRPQTCTWFAALQVEQVKQRDGAKKVESCDP